MARKLCHAWGIAAALALLLLASNHPAFAAQTGKIAGRVTDRASGEPLTGAAVVIQGTRIGASTDADGYYFLINIPPGNYSLEVSIIGYRPQTVENVRVNVDRTTPIDVGLESAAIEVGGVTVVAPREVIQLDVSGSKTILEAGDVTAVPVKSVQEALALEPNVGVTGGIRGGGLDQTQMIVDGRLAVDERLNKPVMTISSSALEEVQVLTGGFNAEYGNARSGVINVVTRDAIGVPLWGGLNVQYYPAHKKFYEPADDNGVVYTAYGPNSFEWKHYGNSNLNTVIVTQIQDSRFPNDPTKTVADTVFHGWNAAAADPALNPKGLSAQDLQKKWKHQHPAWDYGNKADYVVDGAVGVPINKTLGAMVSFRKEYTPYATPQFRPAYEDQQLDVKLNVRPSDPLQVNLGFMLGSEGGIATSPGRGLDTRVYRDFGPSINFLNASTKYAQYGKTQGDIDRWALRAAFTYTFDRKSFADGGLEFTRFSYSVLPGKPVTPAVLILHGTSGIDSVDSVPIGYLGTGRTDGTWMSYELAGQGNSRDTSNYHSIRAYVNYTNQISARNLVKLGYEGVFITINQRGGRASKTGFQMQRYTAEPTRQALFAQDKIEHEGMIANVGIRLDYYNSNGRIYEPNDPWTDLYDHQVWGDVGSEFDIAAALMKHWGPNGDQVKDSLQWKDATAKWHVSPRLGISHPISKTTKIFFNYGHFYTVPDNQYAYGFYPNQPGSLEYIGNPDLDMPRTIQYELGLDQELFGQYLVHVAGYYKDATNEIGNLVANHLAPSQPYVVITPYNKYYSDIRGFEFKVAKRVGTFITGFVNGGVQIQTQTKLGMARIEEDPNTPPTPESQSVSGRSQPFGKLNIDLHTPVNYSPMGLPSLVAGSWSVNWLTSYQRGASTIYDPVSAPGTPPSQAYVKSPNVNLQDWWMSDMRVSKGFSIGKYTLAAYFDIFNVLGRKVWKGSMRADDYQAYLKSLHFPIDDPLIEDTKGNDKIGDTPNYAILPERDRWTLWAYPRTYAFGIKVDF